MGIETPAKSLENTTLSLERGAKSGALKPTKPNLDPGLTSLIDAWATLPEVVRAGIMAMVKAVLALGPRNCKEAP